MYALRLKKSKLFGQRIKNSLRAYLSSTQQDSAQLSSAIGSILALTEVAGEGGPDLAPQKFLLSQQFRYLMRCKKYL